MWTRELPVMVAPQRGGRLQRMEAQSAGAAEALPGGGVYQAAGKDYLSLVALALALALPQSSGVDLAHSPHLHPRTGERGAGGELTSSQIQAEGRGAHHDSVAAVLHPSVEQEKPHFLAQERL